MAMRVYIGDVKKEVGRTAREILEETFDPFSVFGEKVAFSSPVKVNVVLTNCGSELLGEGKVQTELVLTCSRCLEPFVLSFEGALRFEFRNLDLIVRPSDVEAEAEEEGVRYFRDDDTSVDITREVWEVIFMNFPMKPLCDAACLGLCPSCGGNRNRVLCRCRVDTEDPRFQVLKKWKSG